MKRRRRRILTGVLATLLGCSGLFIGAGASASPNGDEKEIIVGGTGKFAAIDDVMRADLEVFAKQDGISFEDAVKKYSWENDFARLVEEARVKFAATFVSAAITHDEEAAAWIAFREVPETWVTDHLLSFPVSIRLIRAVDSPTEVEQSELVQAVHYAVLNTSGVEHVSSSVDPLTGVLTVEFSRTEEFDSSQLGVAAEKAARAALGAVELTRRVSPDIGLKELDSLDQGDQALYGGAQLTKDGVNYCTTGFTVTKLGVSGILTAAHCGPGLKYGPSTPLAFQTAHLGSSGDIEWLSTSAGISNNVYISSSSTVAITATGGPTVGQTLSFYGRTTGASSDKVKSLNECVDNACNLTMTEKKQTDGGDSGGPWRSGSVAYGIHKGYKTVGGVQRCLFTRVGLANTALGVVIKTTP